MLNEQEQLERLFKFHIIPPILGQYMFGNYKSLSNLFIFDKFI